MDRFSCPVDVNPILCSLRPGSTRPEIQAPPSYFVSAVPEPGKAAGFSWSGRAADFGAGILGCIVEAVTPILVTRASGGALRA